MRGMGREKSAPQRSQGDVGSLHPSTRDEHSSSAILGEGERDRADRVDEENPTPSSWDAAGGHDIVVEEASHARHCLVTSWKRSRNTLTFTPHLRTPKPGASSHRSLVTPKGSTQNRIMPSIKTPSPKRPHACKNLPERLRRPVLTLLINSTEPYLILTPLHPGGGFFFLISLSPFL